MASTLPLRALVGSVALVSGCCFGSVAPEAPHVPLRELRRDYHTAVLYDDVDHSRPVEPPPDIFELVTYPAPLGPNHAYVTPETSARHAAIVWIAGGFDWGLSPGAWEPFPRDNDQSARAFRDAGIVLMLPSLRGSHDNPGRNECFFGEVEDILAAAAFLATRADVDPARIYLGGHSTGGTLALLTAESSDRFRAVFAFGAIDDPRGYGSSGCMPDDIDAVEARLRAPIEFVEDIRTPTWIIEGEDGNARAAAELYAWRGTAPLDLIIVPGVDHFSALAPGTEAVAQAILAAGTGAITITSSAIQQRIR